MKNSKKRIIAVCASCAVITSMLAGCSKDAKEAVDNIGNAVTQAQNTLDFYTSIEAAKEIKNFNYDIDLDANLSSDGENMLLGLDLDGTVIDGPTIEEDACTMNMAVDIVVPDTADIKNLELTSITMKDKTVYVNVKKIMQALPKLSEMGSSGGVTISEEEINEMFTSLGITSDYVKINLDDLSESMVESGVTVNINDETLTAEGEKFVKDLTERLEKAFGSLKTQFIGTSGDQYTFQITNEDVGVICDCIISFINNDLLAVYDNLIASAESMGYTPEEIEELKASRPSAEQITELVNSINSIKDGTTEIPDFKVDCWTTFAGTEENHDRAFASKFSTSISAEVENDYSMTVDPYDDSASVENMMNLEPSTVTSTINADVTANIKIAEVPSSTEITIPEGEHTDFNDVMAKIEELNGSSYEYDSSYSTWPDDEYSYDESGESSYDYNYDTSDPSYILSDDAT